MQYKRKALLSDVILWDGSTFWNNDEPVTPEWLQKALTIEWRKAGSVRRIRNQIHIYLSDDKYTVIYIGDYLAYEEGLIFAVTPDKLEKYFEAIPVPQMCELAEFDSLVYDIEQMQSLLWRQWDDDKEKTVQQLHEMAVKLNTYLETHY